MQVDYLVVGSGLTGATIARLLHDAGREVLIVERRAHCGGNVHDHLHPSGIRIHTYGPHDFRTLEWKQMMPPEQTKGIKGTVITRETPFTPADPNQYEYPFPDQISKALFGDIWLRQASKEYLQRFV